MAFREDLQRRIEKKKAEIADLRTQVALEERYLQAMLDLFKVAPRESVAGSATSQVLRKGSMTAKAYTALKRVGKPMHVKSLLELIGKEPSRNNYSSLSSSLNSYARKTEIFTKPGPNVFGLVEFGPTSEEGETSLFDAPAHGGG